MPVRCMPTSRSTSSSMVRAGPANAAPNARAAASSSTTARNVTSGKAGPAAAAGPQSARPADRRAARRSRPLGGEHLGFGDRRALHAREPERDVHPRDRRQLVGLHVRPQPRRRRPQSRSDAADSLRRGRDRRATPATESRRRSGWSTSSQPHPPGLRALAPSRLCIVSAPRVNSSVRISPRSPRRCRAAATPCRRRCARRRRRSGPQISANSSEQPLMTFG